MQLCLKSANLNVTFFKQSLIPNFTLILESFASFFCKFISQSSLQALDINKIIAISDYYFAFFDFATSIKLCPFFFILQTLFSFLKAVVATICIM